MLTQFKFFLIEMFLNAYYQILPMSGPTVFTVHCLKTLSNQPMLRSHTATLGE